MIKSITIKKLVQKKYAQIARLQKDSCCVTTPNSCCDNNKTYYLVFKKNYSQLDGYVADADLNLGCGLPTQYAEIKPGNVVLDLGSGAGNDVFVARKLVGDQGRVIGIDLTPEMIKKALQNNRKPGYKNVEFRLGEIENLPLRANEVDVVISNCVLNLVPDKVQAFKEIYRVLRPGGKFCISDIVYLGQMVESLKHSAELYAGCVAGALEQNEYLSIIHKTGFKKITIQKKKKILLPDKLLENYLSNTDLNRFDNTNFELLSITVTAQKLDPIQ